MTRIFKNLKPYWKALIIILVLLVLQAYCDLSLPQYTSNIIDTGIQNGGIEHILPEKITSDEFDIAKIFMTEDEVSAWENSYEKDGDMYKLTVKDQKDLDALDDQLSMALIMNNQMSSMEESQFKTMIVEMMNSSGQASPQSQAVNPNAGASAMTQLNPDDITVEDIEKMLNVDLHITTKTEKSGDGSEKEITCVDVRQVFKANIERKTMTNAQVLQTRDSMETSFEAMGTSLVKSMGIAYAKNQEKIAGIDMNAKQMGYLWNAGFKMIGMALVIALSAVLVSLVASRVGAGIGRDLRGSVYKKVIGFSNSEMDKFSTASLITRTTNDVQQIQMVTVMMLRMVIYAPILGIGGIFKVLKTGSGMEWIIVLAVVVVMTFVGILMAVAMPKFKLMQKLVDRVNLVSREILTGLSVIRAFGREKKEEERFDGANKDLTKTMLFTNRVMSLMMPVMTVIMNGVTLLIVWVSANRIDSGALQVGSMTAFITYAMQIIMSFLMLTMMSVMLPRAAVSADRIDEVLKTHSSIEDPKQPETISEHKGVVKFNHVNFKYPGADENALEDIDFIAEPGKTTAIIGSTGCGKTTLVNLIPRLYDVTDGSVTIDGHDVRNISMEELRDELGYVPQKGVLFSGTIASNLRFGNDGATDEEIEKAAKIAQATEFIDEKSEKYDSSISQGGSNVSGGQKQRLSIARAIAKNPNVFIFDDSFSALDLKTDSALRKALAKEVGEATIITVAQRIGTVIHADQILVMDDGKIVGKGKHEDLLRNCDVYQQIARSQMSAKELGLDEENGRENA